MPPKFFLYMHWVSEISNAEKILYLFTYDARWKSYFGSTALNLHQHKYRAPTLTLATIYRAQCKPMPNPIYTYTFSQLDVTDGHQYSWKTERDERCAGEETWLREEGKTTQQPERSKGHTEELWLQQDSSHFLQPNQPSLGEALSEDLWSCTMPPMTPCKHINTHIQYSVCDQKLYTY